MAYSIRMWYGNCVMALSYSVLICARSHSKIRLPKRPIIFDEDHTQDLAFGDGRVSNLNNSIFSFNSQC